ncbi:MAG: hypothetical protein GXO39_05045 [Thermotogae bacterium]|nr:hypothetical protein [Thermotogota bacterium]
MFTIFIFTWGIIFALGMGMLMAKRSPRLSFFFYISAIVILYALISTSAVVELGWYQKTFASLAGVALGLVGAILVASAIDEF